MMTETDMCSKYRCTWFTLCLADFQFQCYTDNHEPGFSLHQRYPYLHFLFLFGSNGGALYPFITKL